MKGGGLKLASLRERTDGDPREIRARIKSERHIAVRDHEDFSTFVFRATGGKLSTRPETYSGRGPMRGDLGPDHLAMIQKLVRSDYGPTAELQYLRFVLDLPDLSASGFLTAFWRFFTGGLVASAGEQRTVDRIGLDGPSPASAEEEAALHTSAHIGIRMLLHQDRSPESWAWESAEIKAEFLERAGVTDAGRVFEALDLPEGMGGRHGMRRFRGHRWHYGDR